MKLEIIEASNTRTNLIPQINNYKLQARAWIVECEREDVGEGAALFGRVVQIAGGPCATQADAFQLTNTVQVTFTNRDQRFYQRENRIKLLSNLAH